MDSVLYLECIHTSVGVWKKQFGPILFLFWGLVLLVMRPMMSKAWSGGSLDDGLALLSAVHGHNSGALEGGMNGELQVPW